MKKIKMLQTVEDSSRIVKQDETGKIITDDKGNPVIEIIVGKYFKDVDYPVQDSIHDKLVSFGYAESLEAQ